MEQGRSVITMRATTVRRHFEQWRRNHPPRTRFSDKLWREAVLLAQAYGLHRTARLLRLDYYSLKKRLPSEVRRPTPGHSKPAFVELIPEPAAAPQQHDCTLELENASGTKLRLQLRGDRLRDAVQLSRLFWDRTR